MTQQLDELAQKIWGMAVNDDLDGALALLESAPRNHRSCRLYEIQSSVCDAAYGISKEEKYMNMNVDSILSRISLDMMNPRLFMDIGDYLNDRNRCELAIISYRKARSRLSTLASEDWREEIERRLSGDT